MALQETLVAALETPAQFRSFVEALPAGSQAGYACDRCNCPIAKFAQTMIPEDDASEYVEVGDGYIEGAGWDFYVEAWAQRFIAQLDRRRRTMDAVPVTREDVLAVLEEVAQ